jgi:hypothetical protein
MTGVCLSLVEMGLKNAWPRPALNYDPPDHCLLSGQDYRCELAHSAYGQHFKKHFKKEMYHCIIYSNGKTSKVTIDRCSIYNEHFRCVQLYICLKVTVNMHVIKHCSPQVYFSEFYY